MRVWSWLLGESHAADEQMFRPWRVVRAAVVGLCALVLAYGGHRVAGGGSVGPATLAVPAAVSMSGAWLLSRRRFTLLSLIPVLASAQLAFHGWFALLAARGHSAMAPGMVSMSTSAESHPRVMVLAHVLAALATAVLLRQGDQALLHLVVAFVRRLFVRPVTDVGITVSAPPVRLTALSERPRHSLVVGSAQPHRGPPAHRVV